MTVSKESEKGKIYVPAWLGAGTGMTVGTAVAGDMAGDVAEERSGGAAGVA